MGIPIRILYLAPCRPTENAFGTQLRTLQIASALQTLGQLDFIVVKLEEDGGEVVHASDSAFAVRRVIKLRPVGARSMLERLRCGLDPKFMGYHGHAAPAEDRAYVAGELPQYDLVWLHHIRTANALGRWAWPRSVMDVDDVPSTYFRSVLQSTCSPRARLRARFDLRLARQRER